MVSNDDAVSPNAQYPGDRAQTVARIGVAYFAFGVFSRLLEDAFQALGLTSFDEANSSLVLVVIATLASFLMSLAMTGTQLTLVTTLLLKRKIGLSPGRAIELIMIESLRAISATIRRLPLLILPALFEWVRLAPVPFLVLLDEAYARGERDILVASREFFKKHRALVTGLVIVSMISLALEFSLTSTPQDSLPIWQAPTQHIGSIAAISFLHLIADLFMVAMYARAVDRSHKTKVS